MKSICLYCGSNAGNDPQYTEAAQAMGRALAERKITMIYGGGNVGLMGLSADACIAAGGKVIGVIPQVLVDYEKAHRGLNELHVVKDMHERKMTMIDLSEGFIAMPGGLGTMEELFEVITWGQLRLHNKPVGLFNVNGYFTHLLAFLDHAMGEGFVHPMHRETFLTGVYPEEIIEKMENFNWPVVDKWTKPKG